MGRPKGSFNTSQGDDATKTDDIFTEKTVIKEVKVNPLKVDEYPLKKDDLYLLIVDGVNTYWTKSQAVIALQRNRHEIEIPEGSSFVAPINSKCKGCG